MVPDNGESDAPRDVQMHISCNALIDLQPNNPWSRSPIAEPTFARPSFESGKQVLKN
jgi:hypothetical protein